jgi:type VI secretion system protein ImpI
MRLRLVAQTPLPETDKGWRILERGELTLGRDPSCGWVLPDPSRTVSKIHCRIRRDATGFTVTDESTNGMSVDRRPLAHGQTARLQTGSVIDVCNQRFAAEITGEAEPDWQDPDARYALSDDAPSITAILSDVSPGGRTASGVLPGRSGEEDWLAALDARESAPQAQADRASRPVIGWREPIDLAITGGSRLPEDWDTEAATSTRAEHRVATSTRMRVPRPPGSDPVPAEASARIDGPSAADALDAFLQGGGTASAGDPLIALREAGRADRDMRRALARLDRALGDVEEEAGVEASPDGLETLPARQQRLLEALRALLAETDAMAPSRLAMQARVDNGAAPRGLAARLPLPGGAERAVLALHRRLFEGDEAGSPRSRFNRRLRSGPSGDPSGDDFVELSADRPRGGDWE